MRRALPIFALLLAVPALAQDQPLARIEMDREEVPVGEPVTVRITALCPTFLPKPPRFPTAELANAVTRILPIRSGSVSERVDGELWSGVTRQYEIYPLMGATYRLGDQSVAVTCAVPGTITGTTLDVPLEEISFRAVVPTGAESLSPYLSGSSLELERSLDGEPDSLEAGDALVVTYVAELDGLPAIFLPPLAQIDETPGVSVYADQPLVEDAAPARRTERYTFVFEAGGDFAIPGAALDWWNPEVGRVESSAIDPMTVSVAGDPLPALGEQPVPGRPFDWRKAALGLLLLVLVLRLLRYLLPRLRAAREASRQRLLASEEYAFRQLGSALRGGDRRAAQAALLEWLERIAPGLGPRAFAERHGDDRLKRELERLSRTVYRDGSEPVELQQLRGPLLQARRRAKREQRSLGDPALPPLNP